jgi:hypothetical protein
MALDMSWARSAPAYVAAYDQAIAAHRGAEVGEVPIVEKDAD